MLLFMSSPLGIIIFLLSLVRRVVYIRLMALTLPSTPLAMIYSPTLKGLKMRSMMPPAMLERAPCRERPMAIPADASTVITDAMGTPRTLMMLSIIIMFKTMFTPLVTKEETVLSAREMA